MAGAAQPTNGVLTDLSIIPFQPGVVLGYFDYKSRAESLDTQTAASKGQRR